MNESHKYKLIFFHLPKNAGVSVRRAIGIDRKSHKFPFTNVSVALPIDVKAQTLDSIYNDYHKFTIVRNPYERMVSLYNFRKQGNDLYDYANLKESSVGPDGKVWDFNRWIKSPEMKGTTSEGLKRMCSDSYFNSYWAYKSKDRGYLGRNYLRSHLEYLNQVDFLTNPLTGGRLMTDTILRQENLKEEWDKMFEKLGYESPKLPQRNKSEHKHYSHYYDDESVQLVSKIFNKDLKFFKYEFEDKR